MVGVRAFEVVVVGMVVLVVGVRVLGVMLVGVRVLVVGVMVFEVVVVAMLVLVVGVRFLGVVLVGVRVLVVGALLPSSLLPPPSSAAVSVQGRRNSYTGASGRLAAAGFGADALSRPQQIEVQQVGLLPHRPQWQ